METYSKPNPVSTKPRAVHGPHSYFQLWQPGQHHPAVDDHRQLVGPPHNLTYAGGDGALSKIVDATGAQTLIEGTAGRRGGSASAGRAQRSGPGRRSEAGDRFTRLAGAGSSGP